VPLSEHEQHLLEQIERALVAEDPKFASTVRAADPRQHVRRRVVLASTVAVVGLALVCVGIIFGRPAVLGVPIVSVVGFFAMFGGLVFGLSAYRHRQLEPAGGGSAETGPGERRRSSIFDRLEDRFRRRPGQWS
jgi:type IV secretory pathway VirB2 component (pilin)